MEAKELRIGNFVMYSSVITVNENKIKECVQHPERFGPLGLTEEWLLKFGFEKVVYDSDETGYGTEYELKCSSDVFMVYQDDFSVALYSCKEVIGRDLSVIPTWNQVKTVHGLQNLYFALTGNELTIKQ